MQKVLNQEEIDALFKRARGQTDAPHARQVTSCNFGSSGQITKEQLRVVTALHETFARNLTHGLGAYLRIGLEIAVVSVEQLAYSEFLQRVADLTYLATFKINELDTVGAINMELPIAYPILDLLLGGRGRPELLMRELTEIEQEILGSVMVTIVRDLNACWQPMGLTFGLEGRQTGDDVAQIMSPLERVMTISFEMRLPEVRAMLSIVLPVAVSSLMQRNLQKGTARRHGASPQKQQIRNRMMESQFLLELSSPMVRVPAQQLLELEVGSVLMLPHKVQEPISLRVAGTQFFAAFPVARNERRAGFINRVTAALNQDGGGKHAAG